MRTIDYNDNHYEEVSGWFMKRGMKPIPRSSLPKFGKIVPSLAAVFLYQTDSDVCAIENAITNPESDKKIRRQALGVAIKDCISHAKDIGFKNMMFVSDIPVVVEDFAKEHKFKKIEGKVNILWRNLWEA